MTDLSPAGKHQSLLNALTIDVEDFWSMFLWDWAHLELEPTDAVVKNTERLLELLAQHSVKATFFVLGEVAEKFPHLVRAIDDQGHEIGVHGFIHRQIFKLTKNEFRQQISSCKKLLEDITSAHILGYRAPAFSVMPETRWALEILAEEGFGYDSSVFPIAGKRYGWPGFSRSICRIQLPSGRSIIEVPMATVLVSGLVLPAAGGGYIRHFPYLLTYLALRRIQKEHPAVVYLHPHEIDTEYRRIQVGHLPLRQKLKALKSYTMQMRNRRTGLPKIRRLLSDFRFSTIRDVIERSSLALTSLDKTN